MQQGNVKWFNEARGYGFITPKDGSKDVFVHYSKVEMKGYKTLQEGQAVDFEFENSPKGPQATRVVPR